MPRICEARRRFGRGGRPFELLKFRSMCVAAEERERELASETEAAEGFFKLAYDPRIARVRRLLRRTNLDELPQLLNILRGEMSLVEPRPLIPQEDRRWLAGTVVGSSSPRDDLPLAGPRLEPRAARRDGGDRLSVYVNWSHWT